MLKKTSRIVEEKKMKKCVSFIYSAFSGGKYLKKKCFLKKKKREEKQISC